MGLLNCHAPLENQQPTLIKEFHETGWKGAFREPNPHYDPDYQNEG